MCACTWLHCCPPSSNPSGKPLPHAQCACTMTTYNCNRLTQTTAQSNYVFLVLSKTKLLIPWQSQPWMLMAPNPSPGGHMHSHLGQITATAISALMHVEDKTVQQRDRLHAMLLQDTVQAALLGIHGSSKHTAFLSCSNNSLKPQ
jgi:hypothetical protein